MPYNPQNPRFAHTCNAVGGSQIVTIGGVDANSNLTFGFSKPMTESTYNTSADPFSQGLGIFDMTALRFVDGYAAGANAYEQSDPIKEFYTQSQKYVFPRRARNVLKSVSDYMHLLQCLPTESRSRSRSSRTSYELHK